MKFSNNFYRNIAYGFLIFLFFLVFIHSFRVKNNIITKLKFREQTNINSNINPEDIKEGFSINLNNNKNNNKNGDNIFALIERKLKGLTQELGGESGKKETKQILINTKKICDLESSKCMMNMLEENKGIKSLDLESLINNDDSENCIKCKKYTELSSSIKSMIDNL